MSDGYPFGPNSDTTGWQPIDTTQQARPIDWSKIPPHGPSLEWLTALASLKGREMTAGDLGLGNRWYVDYGAPFTFNGVDWQRVIPPIVCLPLMTKPSPDTAERKRLEMQAIPFALPERKP